MVVKTALLWLKKKKKNRIIFVRIRGLRIMVSCENNHLRIQPLNSLEKKSVEGRHFLFNVVSGVLRVTIPPCLLPCSHSPQAAQRAHNLHTDTAGHPGGAVLQNPLPRHFHEGGSGPQDQPARVTCTGKQATARVDDG